MDDQTPSTPRSAVPTPRPLSMVIARRTLTDFRNITTGSVLHDLERARVKMPNSLSNRAALVVGGVALGLHYPVEDESDPRLYREAARILKMDRGEFEAYLDYAIIEVNQVVALLDKADFNLSLLLFYNQSLSPHWHNLSAVDLAKQINERSFVKFGSVVVR